MNITYEIFFKNIEPNFQTATSSGLLNTYGVPKFS